MTAPTLPICAKLRHDPWPADDGARAEAADTIEALYGQLDAAQTDLDLLRLAIEADDPKAELLIRVTDLWKRNDKALSRAPSQPLSDDVVERVALNMCEHGADKGSYCGYCGDYSRGAGDAEA
jgi:hypothetical protein